MHLPMSLSGLGRLLLTITAVVVLTGSGVLMHMYEAEDPLVSTDSWAKNRVLISMKRGPRFFAQTTDFANALTSARQSGAERIIYFAYAANLFSMWENCGCVAANNGGGLPRMSVALSEAEQLIGARPAFVIAGNVFAIPDPPKMPAGIGPLLALKHRRMAEAINLLRPVVYALADGDVMTAGIQGYAPDWIDSLNAPVVRSDTVVMDATASAIVRATEVTLGDERVAITAFGDLEDREALLAKFGLKSGLSPDREELGISSERKVLLIYSGSSRNRLQNLIGRIRPQVVFWSVPGRRASREFGEGVVTVPPVSKYGAALGLFLTPVSPRAGPTSSAVLASLAVARIRGGATASVPSPVGTVHTQELLDGAVVGDEAVLQVMRHYLRDLARNWRRARIPADHARPVEHESCSKCHLSEVKGWGAGPHSRALKALRAKKKQYDPTCLRCHHSAFSGVSLDSGPFRSNPFLEYDSYHGVSCLSCHRVAAKAHAAKPRVHRIGTISPNSCRECHDPHNSPSFQFLTYIDRVGCLEPRREESK